MKKSRTARNLKRRVKTRKVMRGGEMNEPVNKDVIDALKKVVDSMKADGKYPKLKNSLEELIHVSDASSVNATSSTVNAASPPVNAASPPVNATSSTVNATSPTVNATSPTVNATSPTVNAESTVNVNAVPPVNDTNEPKAELTEKSVIQYGTDSEQSSKYFEIKNRLQKMIDNPNTRNPDNISVETLKSRLEEITNAKTIPEVTAILQKYQFSDTHAQRPPAFLRFAMTSGGSRKHKMRRIKNQYTSK